MKTRPISSLVAAVYDHRTPQHVYRRSMTVANDGTADSNRRKLPPPNRRFSAGFSLTEVVIALGLIMAAALPTIGVLSIGLGDARITATQHSIESLRGTLRARLQDPSWPAATSSTAWTHSVYFDSLGAEARHRHQADAAIEAHLTAAPGIGFDSPGLETVKVEFLAIASGEVLGSCLVQRARPDRMVGADLP